MAGKIPNRIANEEEYLELSMRMVKGAEIMDHPLTTPEKRAELMVLYDQMDVITRKWLSGGAAASDTPPEASPEPNAPPQPEEPAEEPTAAPVINVSAWLD